MARSTAADRQWAVAVHEAGHAVAAALLNVSFGSVSIEPDDHSGGRISWITSQLCLRKFNASKRPALMLRREGRRMSIIALAGWAAEAVLVPGFREGASDDFKQVRSEREHISALLQRALHLMRQRNVQTAVRRTARELVARSSITSTAVTTIVAGAITPAASRQIVSVVLADA